MKRLLSLAVAVAMMVPAFASIVEAAEATWLSPQPGQKITSRMVEVSVGYNTQSDQKVTRLELWVDGNLYNKKFLVQPEVRGVSSFTWDTAKFSNGPHNLVVKIYSGDQLLTNVSGTGSVGDNVFDTRPPVITFANIKSGDVLKGSKDIKLKVADDSGENPIVSLKVDNVLKLLKNTPPFVYKLDTTTYTDGSHSLETSACDTSGNKGNSTVVNVTFNNGIKRPVLAAMSVESKTAPNPVAQDDEIIRSLPPVAVAPVQPEVKQSAARSDDSAAKVAIAAPPASPAAKSIGPIVKSAPAASAKPANVNISAASSDIRKSEVKPVTVVADASAEPIAVQEARTSNVGAVKASVMPEAKTVRVASADGISSAAEPAAVSVSVAEPVAVGVKNISASSASSVKSSHGTFADSRTGAEVPTVNAAKQAKPVQVAMLMGVKDDPSRSSFLAPNPPRKDDKAKLEKTTVVVSSMVQLRDLFNKLGGTVVWDADTHTIIASAYDIRLEMKLGSNVVKVNGKDMTVASATYVENGRTYVDDAVYHNLCDILTAQGLAAFAGIK